MGELVISRTALEQRVAQLEQQIVELHHSTGRLRRASGEIESEYETTALLRGPVYAATGTESARFIGGGNALTDAGADRRRARLRRPRVRPLHRVPPADPRDGRGDERLARRPHRAGEPARRLRLAPQPAAPPGQRRPGKRHAHADGAAAHAGDAPPPHRPRHRGSAGQAGRAGARRRHPRARLAGARLDGRAAAAHAAQLGRPWPRDAGRPALAAQAGARPRLAVGLPRRHAGRAPGPRRRPRPRRRAAAQEGGQRRVPLGRSRRRAQRRRRDVAGVPAGAVDRRQGDRRLRPRRRDGHRPRHRPEAARHDQHRLDAERRHLLHHPAPPHPRRHPRPRSCACTASRSRCRWPRCSRSSA